MDVTVDNERMVRGLFGTVALLFPANSTSTDDAPVGVSLPISITTEVPLSIEQDFAAVPVLGVSPTFALHEFHVNPVPVIVIVLPTYAEVGKTESAV